MSDDHHDSKPSPPEQFVDAFIESDKNNIASIAQGLVLGVGILLLFVAIAWMLELTPFAPV